MELKFFYGPDKIPFSPNAPQVGLPDEATPFHGIISRGLLEKFEEKGLGSQVWHAFAHLIFLPQDNETDHELKTIQQYAQQAEVLSFQHSAMAAATYATSYLEEHAEHDRLTVELWNIKEGHTSSVWRVSIRDTQQPKEEFILNVARDYKAGVELNQISKKMQAISAKYPDIKMSRVDDIREIILDEADNFIKVVVTRNEFIAEAFEIHSLQRASEQDVSYFLVERFLTSEETPSHISSIRGRKFNDSETATIKNIVHAFSEKISGEFDTALNINDGDLVWNGSDAVIVAIT